MKTAIMTCRNFDFEKCQPSSGTNLSCLVCGYETCPPLGRLKLRIGHLARTLAWKFISVSRVQPGLGFDWGCYGLTACVVPVKWFGDNQLFIDNRTIFTESKSFGKADQRKTDDH